MGAAVFRPSSRRELLSELTKYKIQASSAEALGAISPPPTKNQRLEIFLLIGQAIEDRRHEKRRVMTHDRSKTVFGHGRKFFRM